MSLIHRLQVWARDDPARAAAWVIGVFLAYSVLPVLFSGPATAEFDYLAPDALPVVTRFQWFHAAAAIGIAGALGWWASTGLTGGVDVAGLRFSLWIIMPVITLFFMVTSLGLSLEPDTFGDRIGLILLLTLAISITEEVLFRGVLFHGMRSRGTLWRAVIGSSLIFGAFHGVNAFYGQDGMTTAYQIIFATCIGVLFCGLRLQSGSLWPPIALHMMWNAYVMAANIVSDSQRSLGDVAPDPGAMGWPGVIVPLFMLWLGCVAIIRWHRRTVA